MRTAFLMVAILTAATAACSGTAQLTDRPPLASVATITITPASIATQIGKSVQLSAIARDSAGNVLNDRSASWSSTDTAIAQVSTSGLVSARKVGGASIHVSIEAKAAQAAITVAAVPAS